MIAAASHNLKSPSTSAGTLATTVCRIMVCSASLDEDTVQGRIAGPKGSVLAPQSLPGATKLQRARRIGAGSRVFKEDLRGGAPRDGEARANAEKSA